MSISLVYPTLTKLKKVMQHKDGDSAMKSNIQEGECNLLHPEFRYRESYACANNGSPGSASVIQRTEWLCRCAELSDQDIGRTGPSTGAADRDVLGPAVQGRAQQ